MNEHESNRTVALHGSVPVPIVRAAGLLNCYSRTGVINISELTKKSETLIQQVDIADFNGILYCLNKWINHSCWLKIITLAKDFRNCNVLLVLKDHGVMLQTTRIVTPGEPLFMWFSSDIAAAMNIPVILPMNMSGLMYSCHKCMATFYDPNPLKIHIALECDKLNFDSLWEELAKKYNNQPHRNFLLSLTSPLPSPYDYQLARHHQQQQQRMSPIPVGTVKSRNEMCTRPSSSSMELSLPSTNRLSPSSPFQISRISSSTNIDTTSAPVLSHSSAFRPYLRPRDDNNQAFTPTSNNYKMSMKLLEQMRTDEQAAQLEEIVSSIGRRNNGYFCIYCHKFYSRRYGLKIHIRIHTGRKPLKCSYCLRAFGDPSNLNKHIRLHNNKTKYYCDVCRKVFVRRRDLERHINSLHRTSDDISEVSSDRDA